ncbi:F-box only protein 28-like [Ornithodoros turicata]|uniref:F-box only protein 28-like n=1 Tax=Ornithodoros turicata TaxID=34597 RepID=UPI00313A1382
MEGNTQKDWHGPITLGSLPMEIIESVLSYLSYDEISSKRVVCRKFDLCCKNLLNQGFLKVERFHAKCLKQVKKQLPRRESERRSHPLSRHCEILTSIETRLSLLGMTFTKYMDMSLCCFIPGKVIDEIYRVLRLLQKEKTPPRTHEILQELRDISSMAMEHFDERIAPGLKLHILPPRPFLAAGLVCGGSPGTSFPPPYVPPRPYQNRCSAVSCSHGGLLVEVNQLKATCAALLRCNADSKLKLSAQWRKLRDQAKSLQEQERSIREQTRVLSEQATRLAEQEGKLGEMNRKLLEQHKQFIEVVSELQSGMTLEADSRAGRKRSATVALLGEEESPSRRKTRSMQPVTTRTSPRKAPAKRTAAVKVTRQRKP